MTTGKPSVDRDRLGLGAPSGRCRSAAGAEPEPLDQRLEAVAVLGEVDRLGRGAEDRDLASSSAWASLSGVWPPNCTITPLTVPLVSSVPHDLEHVLFGQRLEIEPVRGVVVGRYRLRIAIDHDGLEARGRQRECRMAAAIVELDALADAVGAAAEDDDLLGVRRAAPRIAPARRSPSRRSSTYRRSARRTPPRRYRCAYRPGARRAPCAGLRPRSPRARRAWRAARRKSPSPSARGIARRCSAARAGAPAPPSR